jgi:ubiquinone/menaquinone biosynthesis C-methylase UbiE
MSNHTHSHSHSHTSPRPYVCPAEFSGSLDNKLRRRLHDPRKILEPLITKGMTVLDLGCGPGYFTIALADLVGETGRVMAIDLQQGMLERVREKMEKSESGKRITLHKCEADKLGLTEKVDFILAFWMLHEVPDQERLFAELKTLINPDGKIFIVEPKWHVTARSFNNMISITEKIGFKIIATRKVFFSRSVVLTLN